MYRAVSGDVLENKSCKRKDCQTKQILGHEFCDAFLVGWPWDLGQEQNVVERKQVENLKTWLSFLSRSIAASSLLFFLFIASAKVTASCQVECQLWGVYDLKAGIISLLVSLVEEPAMDLAIGGVEGSMFHEQVHLGHHQCGAGFEKGQEVVKLEKTRKWESLTRRLGGSQTRWELQNSIILDGTVVIFSA